MLHDMIWFIFKNRPQNSMFEDFKFRIGTIHVFIVPMLMMNRTGNYIIRQ